MKNLKYLFILLLSISLPLSAQIDRSKAPQPGPAPTINIPAYQQFTLKNGLKVFVVENHKIPMVAYNLTIDIDPFTEGENAGYVQLTGDLLRAGTTSRTKDKLDEEIDFIGATLNTSSRGIYARSLTKHSDQMLALMSDVLLNPIFPQPELDKLKKQAVTSIISDKDEPRSIANNVAKVLRNGANHPYGEITSEQSVEKITIEDCKKYYNTYFHPNISYLVIVGDINLKEAKKQAKKYFSTWKPAEVPTHKVDFPELPNKPVVALANKDGANQSVIQVTFPISLKPGDADAIKASVMNQILGGGSFSSHLIANLREDKAYTYGAYSRLNMDEHVGFVSASAQVRGEITDSALTEVINELVRMKTEPVTQSELDLFKNMMTGDFARSLENPQTIARFALNIEKYHLPKDYYQTYLQKLASVTVTDISEMANKYLKPENAYILAVGNATIIKPLMARLSPSHKVIEYDYYGKEVIPSNKPMDLTATDVINKYLMTTGGIDQLNTLKSLNTEIELSVGPMKLQVHTFMAEPGKLCIETIMGGNVVSKQVVNGNSAKVTSPMGEKIITGEDLETMKYEAQIVPELSYLADSYKTELIGNEKVDGVDSYKLQITFPNGTTKTAFYAIETGLKTKEVSQTPQGVITTLYKSWQPINQFQCPKLVLQSVGPQNVELNYVKIVVNPAVDDTKFKIE